MEQFRLIFNEPAYNAVTIHTSVKEAIKIASALDVELFLYFNGFYIKIDWNSSINAELELDGD